MQKNGWGNGLDRGTAAHRHHRIVLSPDDGVRRVQRCGWPRRAVRANEQHYCRRIKSAHERQVGQLSVLEHGRQACLYLEITFAVGILNSFDCFVVTEDLRVIRIHGTVHPDRSDLAIFHLVEGGETARSYGLSLP